METADLTGPAGRGPVLSRRTVLQAGAVLGVAVTVGEFSAPAEPAYGAGGYDPRQRFIRLVGGGNGIIYAIQADGGLY